MNIYEDVTNRIIAELEKGLVPWVKPWSTAFAVPRNYITNRPYSGVNTLLLWMAMDMHGYQTNRWLTFNQARDADLPIRKGEKGIRVVFVKSIKRDTDEDDVEEGDRKAIHIMRSYVVFNIEQCDGDISKLAPETAESVSPDDDSHARAWQIFVSSGARKISGPKACYMPKEDGVMLPPLHAFMDKAREEGFVGFSGYDNYFSTMLHELTHWTGHETRLDRDLRGRFGDAGYAAEELIAELGSAFLCAHTGIAGQLQHASYIGNWLQLLESDPRAIFTAASKAQQACNYLLELEAGEQMERAA